MCIIRKFQLRGNNSVCVGEFQLLRGRAIAHLRGNIARHLIKYEARVSQYNLSVVARKIEELRIGFTSRTGQLSLVCSVQTGCEAYTASYLLVTSPRVKRQGHKTDHLRGTSKNEWRCLHSFKSPYGVMLNAARGILTFALAEKKYNPALLASPLKATYS
jgi:hypothetical protein